MNRITQPDDDPVWTLGARRVDRFHCDAVFRLRRSFHDGPANNGDRPAQPVELPLPDLEMLGDHVTATVAIGHEAELFRYYAAVLQTANEHNRLDVLNGPLLYFQSQAAIIENGRILPWLSWYDGVSEARQVFESLARARPTQAGDYQELLDDLDQHWQLRAVAHRDTVFWLERDWESDAPGEDLVLAFDRKTMVAEANAALERLIRLHASLVAAFGGDWWN